VVARLFVGLRDAEVEDLRDGATRGAPREEHVRRLHVTVDEADRVRLVKTDAALHEQRERVTDRERPVALDPLREVLAFEELHDHVRRAFVEAAHIGHAGCVLALESRRRLRFALEARDDLRRLARLAPHRRDGDTVAELHVRRRDDDTMPPLPSTLSTTFLPPRIEPGAITAAPMRSWARRREYGYFFFFFFSWPVLDVMVKSVEWQS